MAQCPVCGREVPNEAGFCGHCGARIASEAQSTTSATMRDMTHEYERMVRDQPSDANARYMLALALMYDRNWGQAAEQLQEVTRLSPEFADAHANLAVCLAHLGRLDVASDAIAAALALSPGSRRFQRIQSDLKRASGSSQ